MPDCLATMLVEKQSFLFGAFSSDHLHHVLAVGQRVLGAAPLVFFFLCPSWRSVPMTILTPHGDLRTTVPLLR
jgi:hypothetical protein